MVPHALGSIADHHIHNPNCNSEAGYFTFTSNAANPSDLILSASHHDQQDHHRHQQLYLSAIPTLMSNLNNPYDLKFEPSNNIYGVHAPSEVPFAPNSSSYGSTWSVGGYQPPQPQPQPQQHLASIQQDHDQSFSNNIIHEAASSLDHHHHDPGITFATPSSAYDNEISPLMATMMPKLCDIVDGNIPYSSSSTQVGQLDTPPHRSPSCFPGGSCLEESCSQMDYIEAIMSSLPPSSSSSSSSSSLSALSQLSSSQLLSNPNLLPSRWDIA